VGGVIPAAPNEGGLFDKTLVLGMGADPDPVIAVGTFQSQSAIIAIDSR
jgi:hypothetical protein